MAPDLEDPVLMLAALHGQLLRATASHSGCHFQGLHQAARHLVAEGAVDTAGARKLRQIDDAYNVTRHITSVSCKATLANIIGQLAQRYPPKHMSLFAPSAHVTASSPAVSTSAPRSPTLPPVRTPIPRKHVRIDTTEFATYECGALKGSCKSSRSRSPLSPCATTSS